jgi:hypothetical protein
MKSTKLLFLPVDRAPDFTFPIARTCDFSVGTAFVYCGLNPLTKPSVWLYQIKVSGLNSEPNQRSKELLNLFSGLSENRQQLLKLRHPPVKPRSIRAHYYSPDKFAELSKAFLFGNKN